MFLFLGINLPYDGKQDRVGFSVMDTGLGLCRIKMMLPVKLLLIFMAGGIG